jgi:hypothetical protein
MRPRHPFRVGDRPGPIHAAAPDNVCLHIAPVQFLPADVEATYDSIENCKENGYLQVCSTLNGLWTILLY